jgi:hypothetical protein
VDPVLSRFLLFLADVGAAIEAIKVGHHAADLSASVCRLTARAIATGRLSLSEKGRKLHVQSLADVPQRDDRGVALAQLEPADVRAVNAHALSELGLREAGSYPQPLHIPSHQASHVN